MLTVTRLSNKSLPQVKSKLYVVQSLDRVIWPSFPLCRFPLHLYQKRNSVRWPDYLKYILCDEVYAACRCFLLLNLTNKRTSPSLISKLGISRSFVILSLFINPFIAKSNILK